MDIQQNSFVNSRKISFLRAVIFKPENESKFICRGEISKDFTNNRKTYTLNPKVSNFDPKVDHSIAVEKLTSIDMNVVIFNCSNYIVFFITLFPLQRFDLLFDQNFIPWDLVAPFEVGL